MNDELSPAKVRLTDGLGPLVDAEMAAYYEGEYGDHSTARARLLDFARAVIASECVDLRQAAEYAAHKLEGARIWNGQEWHYNPLHPLHYRSALERLRDALRA
jgi:hypothetical protein